MLASRLLSILMLLQTRGRMSAADLAREFEVSARTIHRDIDQLSAAGIPVYAERGRSGGFALMDGYRTKLTGMTQPEAETLFLAGLPGPAAELGLADLLGAARLKLLAALPAEVQPNAERIASRFHLDPSGWFRESAPLPSLRTVAQAVWSGHMLRIDYRSDGEVRTRRLSPLGLVLKGGVWYLVAQNKARILTYRMTSIVEAEMLEDGVTRPKGFDLAAHWRKASQDYETGVYRGEAEVRLSSAGMSLIEMLGPYVAAAARKTAGKPDAKGWMRCTIPIESDGHGVRELMRLGEEVRLIGPAPLLARFRSTLIAMTRLSGGL
jgi:predicted DNA-binding transcriptional regulator YafY